MEAARRNEQMTSKERVMTTISHREPDRAPISWAYEDFIEMGVTGVDTLQPEATNMSPEYLKKNFGGRLFFHGCISTAGPVAYGTPEDVTDYCRRTLDIMMPGGGYCFAPTHALQDNSPTGNVVAMYEAAHTYGRYR